MPRLYAWWDGRLLYGSADAGPDIAASAPGTLQAVTLGGRPWLQYVEDSADRRARFAALLPAGSARPWRRVSAEIESRGPDDLSPLRFVPRHRELSPLTSAVNRLLDRLRTARQRERSFTADAAHELRTPIAAMRVHVE